MIDTGLNGDEEVIINGQIHAIPGKPVTPVQEGAPQAPAAGGAAPEGKPGASPK